MTLWGRGDDIERAVGWYQGAGDDCWHHGACSDVKAGILEVTVAELCRVTPSNPNNLHKGHHPIHCIWKRVLCRTFLINVD
ncbi:hypothetical protein XELAEV_18019901mg [Xenopus laevis]|uniref:Uncharacterized protein n=1 Tax=Xenopus laevis TaxID=8355 RepID=A0A974HPZ8_XENLA|nr:hypothetical protein XELAEV_18019901mg [Xenopus laevis]